MYIVAGLHVECNRLVETGVGRKEDAREVKRKGYCQYR